MEVAAAWEAARAKIRDELGWVRTHPWLDELRPRSMERGVVCLEAGSAALRSTAQNHNDELKGALSETLGRPVTVRVVLSRQARPKQRRGAAQAPEEEVTLEPEQINHRLLLSSFLTGPNNELPFRFAQEALDEPGRWHPLVYYGESGCGKTHLLQGIVNGFRRRYPTRRVVYTSSDRFARHFSLAQRKRQTSRFLAMYREVDMLVVDDLQDMAGKQGTERQLNYTLDHLQMSNRQVVLACAAPPKQIPQLEPGLEGRLLGGQVVELRPPDAPTRRSIVKARCASSQLKLEEDVLDLLITGFELNVRELLCALTRLEAHQRLMETRLSQVAVRNILGDLLNGKLKPPNLDSVSEFVADRLGLSVDQLRSRSRKASVVQGRQLAMALLRDLTPLTLREVGCFFGGRSCASVHFAQQRAKELREEDAQVRDLWDIAGRRFERTST